MKQESNNWIFRQLEKQTSYQVFSVPYGSYVKNTQNKYQTATVERNKPSINGCQSREVTSADHKVLAHQLLTHINSFVACWALSRHIGVSCFQNQTDLRCWTKKSKDRLTFLFSVNTCLQEGAERFKYMYMCINWALFHLLNLVCYWTRGNTLGINFEWASSFTLIKSCFFGGGGGVAIQSTSYVTDTISIYRHLGLTTLPGKLKNIIRLFLLSRNRYAVMNRLYSRNIHGGNKACIQLYVSSIFFFPISYLLQKHQKRIGISFSFLSLNSII